MNREDYEKYHKKGGFYEIPVEVFNDMLDEQEDFIKWLEDKIKTYERKIEECPFMAGILILPLELYKEVLDKFRGAIGE